MRGSEPGPFILRQVREHARAALGEKLAIGPIRPIGRLRINARCKLRKAGERGDEEEIQFQFHLWII